MSPPERPADGRPAAPAIEATLGPPGDPVSEEVAAVADREVSPAEAVAPRPGGDDQLAVLILSPARR